MLFSTLHWRRAGLHSDLWVHVSVIPTLLRISSSTYFQHQWSCSCRQRPETPESFLQLCWVHAAAALTLSHAQAWQDSQLCALPKAAKVHLSSGNVIFTLENDKGSYFLSQRHYRNLCAPNSFRSLERMCYQPELLGKWYPNRALVEAPHNLTMCI